MKWEMFECVYSAQFSNIFENEVINKKNSSLLHLLTFFLSYQCQSS